MNSVHTILFMILNFRCSFVKTDNVHPGNELFPFPRSSNNTSAELSSAIQHAVSQKSGGKWRLVIQNSHNLLYRGSNMSEDQRVNSHERVPRHLIVTEDTLTHVLNLLKQKHPALNKRSKTKNFNATMDSLKIKLRKYMGKKKTRRLRFKDNNVKNVSKDILV